MLKYIDDLEIDDLGIDDLERDHLHRRRLRGATWARAPNN